MAADANSADIHAVVAQALDREFYLFFYPDVAKAGVDPVVHYLSQGWRELRDPAPWFSTHLYLDANKDVARSGRNPFVHYLTEGKAEGRRIAASHLARKAAAKPADEPAAAAKAAGLVRSARVGQRSASEREEVERHFDAAFYLRQVPALAGRNIDLVDHYLRTGWKEGLDPSPDFSTSHYLDTYQDVRGAGVNPFLHYLKFGRSEGREALPYQMRIARMTFEPLVSVIVPTYNHARFLDQRIKSILDQTYANYEIILLDDGSTDGSREMLRAYEARYPHLVRCVLSDVNSGNVFFQWRAGLAEAAGDLVWICESDDFCAPDFLEKAVQPFRNDSVMLSFGRIQFADQSGAPAEGLDRYREDTEPGIWDAPLTRPASEWFRGAFAVSNIIPNAGGCLFRNQPVPDAVWNEALSYRIAGDWFLYCALAGGGQIAYVPDAVAYFRQHQKNTSGAGARGADYYREHERLITAFRERWGTPDDVAVRCYQKVYEQFELNEARKRFGPLSGYFSNDRVLMTEKKSRHILIGFLGFHLGGGELFPIHLANELVARGHLVSMLRLDSGNENARVRAMLDARIAVYDAQIVQEMGADAFIERAGIDLIHSHNAGVEFFLFENNQLTDVPPYVVSLHGSYEITPLPDRLLVRLLRSVSHWVYLTEKNLSHLAGIPIDRAVISHVPNGMPADDRPFHRSREQLGIAEDAIVFAISSRAIAEKGWRAAAEATLLASRRTGTLMHLLLCGSGPEEDRMRRDYAGCPNIRVMGFEDNVNGVYRLSDVVMLPSRFKGESFPLALVQAMQVGRPMIATDIGSIRRMIQPDEAQHAGILIADEDEDASFIESLAEAMKLMLNPALRARLADNAARLGAAYGMDVVADRYEQIYRSHVSGWGAQQAVPAAPPPLRPRSPLSPAAMPLREPGAEAEPLSAVSIDAIVALAEGRSRR